MDSSAISTKRSCEMKKLISFCLVLLLAACGGPLSSPPVPDAALSSGASSQAESLSQPDPAQDPGAASSLLTPYALADLGYALELPTGPAMGISAEDAHGQPLEEVCFAIDAGNTMYGGIFANGAWGSGALWGRYTVVQPDLSQSMTRDNGVALAALQAFTQEELALPGPAVQFQHRDERGRPAAGEGLLLLSAGELEEYLVYSDEAIAVYDFASFPGNLPLEEQLAMEKDGNPFVTPEVEERVLAVGKYLAQLPGGIGSLIYKTAQ